MKDYNVKNRKPPDDDDGDDDEEAAGWVKSSRHRQAKPDTHFDLFFAKSTLISSAVAALGDSAETFRCFTFETETAVLVIKQNIYLYICTAQPVTHFQG